MKIKILALVLSVGLIVSLSGCENTQLNVSVEGQVEAKSNGFIDICDEPIRLVYDSMTRVVYICNHAYGSNGIYTPYFAPNGLPYRYNPETNTFEEIEKEDK